MFRPELGLFSTAGIFYNQKIPESSFIALGVRGCDGTQSAVMVLLIRLICRTARLLLI